MNAGHAVPLFAGMLTQRPWEEITKKEASPLRGPGGLAWLAWLLRGGGMKVALLKLRNTRPL